MLAAALAVLHVLQALAPAIALALIGAWGKSQQAQGAVTEAAKVEHATASAETAIAQAEADAPATPMAVVDRLNAGTF